MNVEQVLKQKKFRTFTIGGLTTDAREFVDLNGSRSSAVNSLIKDLLDREIKFTDEIQSRIWIKKLMVELFGSNFVVNPIEVDNLVQDCWTYTDQFMNDPKWSFLYAKPDNVSTPSTSQSTVQVQVIAEVETKVEIKSDGKIKKGGKQIIAQELYKKVVLDAEVPLTNVQFIQKLQDDLGMTLAGSRTYAYNAKKFWEQQLGGNN